MCADSGALPVTTSDGMPMTNAESASHVPGPVHVDHSADAGCPIPTAPAGCATLTACGAPALPPSGGFAAGQMPRPDRRWGDPSPGRQAARPAPDLPPPRA